MAGPAACSILYNKLLTPISRSFDGNACESLAFSGVGTASATVMYFGQAPFTVTPVSMHRSYRTSFTTGPLPPLSP